MTTLPRKPATRRHVAQDEPEPSILDRIPPHNLDAEKGVLGSLLLDPNLCDDVILVVQAADFYGDAHQRLFRHLVEMHAEGRPIDVTLLVARLKKHKELEAVGDLAYIAEIAQSVPVAAHAVQYAEIVASLAARRGLIAAATEILDDAYNDGLDSQQMLAAAESRVFAVDDRHRVDRITSIEDVFTAAMVEIDAAAANGGATGLATGFPDLDRLTGGLHGSELTILASRPSMGKSALATNIVENVALDQRRPVLMVSLEMSSAELGKRILSSQALVDGNKYRNGWFSAEERQATVEAQARLCRSPLWIDDTPNRSALQVAASARRMKRRGGLDLVVIDYLQLLTPEDPRKPRQEQVADMARRLKSLARELDVPVLCIAQLNRQAEMGVGEKSHRPRLSHLRESGAIEQDADVVMFVHREEYYHPPEEAKAKDLVGKALLMVAKQRAGPTGDINLVWRHQYTRFESAATSGGAGPHSEFDEFNGYGRIDNETEATKAN